MTLESQQELSLSDDNSDIDADEDSEECILRAKSGVEWKETLFRANVRRGAKKHSNRSAGSDWCGKKS